MAILMWNIEARKRIVSYLKHNGVYEDEKESGVILKIMIDDKIIKTQGARTWSGIKIKSLFWFHKPKKTAGRKF